MPDILIRGMEMPPSCKCCPCYEQSLAFPDYIKRCKFGADLPQPWPLQYEKRGDNCPLVELPQHGELIDRDAACERYKHDPKKPEICDGAQDLDWLVRCLNEAPVIVPAERSEP